jgi:hypothetical protein
MGKICQYKFDKTEKGAKEYSFLWNSIYSCSVILTDSLCVNFPWPVFIRVMVNAGIITEAAERQWENQNTASIYNKFRRSSLCQPTGKLM